MENPKIIHARKSCEELKARAVIILAFSDGDVRGASYGETKLECRQTGRTLDAIIEALQSGRIAVWK